MEVIINMKGLDKECPCGSGKLAGQCCKKDEKCPCGSGLKVSECCVRETEKRGKKDSSSK